MRKLLLAAGACLILAAPQAQAQEKDAKAIIDRALAAQGGADKVKSLKAFTAKAKGSINIADMNIDFTLEAYSQPPGKSKSIINLSVAGMQIMVTQVFNDGKGWVMANGEVKEVEKEDLDEHAAMVYVESVTNLFKLGEDKDMKLSTLGEAKVGDVPVVGVQVTKPGKRDVNLYFDKKTNLLLKAEYRGTDPLTKQECAQEKIFSEYKELLPGIKMASKQLVNNDGKRYMEIEMMEIRAVDRHDDSVFNKPQ